MSDQWDEEPDDDLEERLFALGDGPYRDEAVSIEDVTARWVCQEYEKEFAEQDRRARTRIVRSTAAVVAGMFAVLAGILVAVAGGDTAEVAVDPTGTSVESDRVTTTIAGTTVPGSLGGEQPSDPAVEAVPPARVEPSPTTLARPAPGPTAPPTTRPPTFTETPAPERPGPPPPEMTREEVAAAASAEFGADYAGMDPGKNVIYVKAGSNWPTSFLGHLVIFVSWSLEELEAAERELVQVVAPMLADEGVVVSSASISVPENRVLVVLDDPTPARREVALQRLAGGPYRVL